MNYFLRTYTKEKIKLWAYLYKLSLPPNPDETAWAPPQKKTSFPDTDGLRLKTLRPNSSITAPDRQKYHKSSCNLLTLLPQQSSHAEKAASAGPGLSERKISPLLTKLPSRQNHKKYLSNTITTNANFWNLKSKLLLASIILSNSTTIPTIPNISAGLSNKPKYLLSELPYVCPRMRLTPIHLLQPSENTKAADLFH